MQYLYSQVTVWKTPAPREVISPPMLTAPCVIPLTTDVMSERTILVPLSVQHDNWSMIIRTITFIHRVRDGRSNARGDQSGNKRDGRETHFEDRTNKKGGRTK